MDPGALVPQDGGWGRGHVLALPLAALLLLLLAAALRPARRPSAKAAPWGLPRAACRGGPAPPSPRPPAAAAVRCLVSLAVDAAKMACWVALLSPWLARFGVMYLRDPRIIRGVRCGSGPRSFVDVYVPAAHAARGGGGRGTAGAPTAPGTEGAAAQGLPVVVAVMGGAWVIGYRAWNVQLALRLADAGVVVVAVDYRNWPQGAVPDMVYDIAGAITWAFQNVARFGGDPANVLLLAQSAGAHLSSLLLVQRALAQAQARCAGAKASPLEEACRGWAPSSFRGFLGVSGVYDVGAVQAHLASRGFPPHHLGLMCPKGDVAEASPTLLLERAPADVAAAAASAMPPVHLYHGELDNCAPCANSLGFVRALSAAGHGQASVEVKLGSRHAEPVVEDPLVGDDVQVRMALGMLFGREEGLARYRAMPPPEFTAPTAVVDIARGLMPF